jgi:hypothetical protein
MQKKISSKAEALEISMKLESIDDFRGEISLMGEI